ncbi:MAG: hypothetical protein JNK53_01450 [Phycisphaerae bacterium]|nr:hypothetical protein [Phycisphaerae bacterium]
MSERNYWMIGADGKVYGPSDEATMLQWIAERRVTATTQVALSQDGPWTDASDHAQFAGQFSAVGAGPAPMNSAPPLEPTSVHPALSSEWPPSNLQVVLLIGGILNIITGAGSVLWTGAVGIASFGIGWCCCPIALIPLVIGILEVVDYTSARRMQPARYLDRTQIWGIINIVMVLFGNVPAMVCGILQLVWLGDARRKYLSR